MEQALHSVLLEFEHLTLLTVTVGLLISAAVRTTRGRALLSNNGFGKIHCNRFGGVDLVAVSLLLAFYYLSFLAGAQDREGMVMTPELIVVNLVMSLFLVTIVLVTVQWVGGRNPIELFGLDQVSFSKWLLWVVLGILIATPLVLYFSEWIRSEWLEPVFGEMKEQEVVDSMKNSSSLAMKVGMIISACVIAPLVEELVFRGYIYGVLKQFTNPLFAIVSAGALFAAVHLNLPALMPLWVFAIILTLAYELSGSLWVPIGIHAGFNTVSVAVMLSGGGDVGP
ncbi:MAG: type II CAAX endopeptidase family protein [Verrucomicrobiota bacterium]